MVNGWNAAIVKLPNSIRRFGAQLLHSNSIYEYYMNAIWILCARSLCEKKHLCGSVGCLGVPAMLHALPLVFDYEFLCGNSQFDGR